ncbi:hypothetical protein J1N35_014101 [Gossypium stocksii]|uniref:Uncharacterized protein n=1 Tax=Gossypium stocksii TaxID=47602 RepID=A0A9D3VTJ8_9ROSI|nr:hypothetical protein J1N35_014101 [Gossypium stocksii]
MAYVQSSQTNAAKTSSEGRIPLLPLLVHGEKPEKLDATHFKWWQKMISYLTTLNLDKFLTGDELNPSKTKSYSTSVVVVDAWKHNDFVCNNCILNGLANKLYDVIGPLIEKRHYKRLWIESMVLSKCFQVDAITDKFPPSWNDFKNYLKHKRKEMGVEDLILRLRIGDDNKLSMKNENYSLMVLTEKVVEHVAKNHNKIHNKRLTIKGKSITKKFHGKCLYAKKNWSSSQGFQE